MPIYDYACGACGRVTEVIHGIHDHGPRFCPECGAEGSMRKAMTAPAVVFRGSGWAKVDRRTPGGARSGGSGSTKRGGSGPGADAGTSGADAGTSGVAAPASSGPGETTAGGGAPASDGGGD